MALDQAMIADLTRTLEPSDYLRCTPLAHATTPLAHATTPLGMGYGETRFASPTEAFKLLYIAQDLPTSITEAIVRDRFEGNVEREMVDADFTD